MRREAQRFHWTMVLADHAGERAMLVEGRVHQSTIAAHDSVTYFS
jgi:hypothetical protein